MAKYLGLNCRVKPQNAAAMRLRILECGGNLGPVPVNTIEGIGYLFPCSIQP